MSQRMIWDEIASGWTNFRHRPMSEVSDFAKYKTGRILDIGCGNCRNMAVFDGELYGTDFSFAMLKYAKRFCKKKNMDVQLVLSDASHMPFRPNSFDAVICMAVLHCLKGGERLKLLEEIKYLLKNGEEALISVWYKGMSKDAEVPWRKKDITVMRHYHFFAEGELKAAIEKSGLKIMNMFTNDQIEGRINRKTKPKDAATERRAKLVNRQVRQSTTARQSTGASANREKNLFVVAKK